MSVEQTTETEQQAAFSEAWDLLCQLAAKDEIGPLNKLGRVWHRVLDSCWLIWLNGTDGPAKAGPDSDIDLPRFNMYVEFNGWPAGFLDPNSGSIAAGEGANIFTFRDALKAAVDPARKAAA